MAKTDVIPLPGWTPDRMNYATGSVEAINVIPTIDGFRPLNSFTTFSTNSIDARCRGFFSARDTSENWHFYAGDKTKLYKLVGTSFVEATADASGTYNLADSGKWEFVQFGDRVITASPDFDHEPQFVQPGSITFSTSIGSVDVPKMLHIGALRDFVIGGNISSTAGGLTPARVWWSAIRDPTDWTPNNATQCDYQDLPSGQPVQRIIGSAEYAIVFQENSISRMNYIGTPAVFDINPVDERRGTNIPSSVTNWGRFIFYISPDGFYAFDGVESTPIGENNIDDEFFEFFDPLNSHRLYSATDPVLKNVYWSFPGEGATGENNTVFVYHWPEKKWSRINQSFHCIGNISVPGYTLEGLDAVTSPDTGAGTGLDDAVLLDVSLDSNKWKGVGLRLGAFNLSNSLGFFDGANYAGVIQSPELDLVPGQRSQINAVRPLIQSGGVAGVSASIKHRKRLNTDPTQSTPTEMNEDGLCMQRVEDRYHQVTISLSASLSWSLISGVQIEYEPSGDR